jgi:hypothetical protein
MESDAKVGQKDRFSLDGEFWRQTQARVHLRGDSEVTTLTISSITSQMLNLKNDQVVDLYLRIQEPEKLRKK